MSAKFKSKHFEEIDIRSSTHYFFNNMINIKYLDPNKINIEKNLYRNFLIQYIGYATVKNLRYIEIYSLSPLNLIFDQINANIEERDGNK